VRGGQEGGMTRREGMERRRGGAEEGECEVEEGRKKRAGGGGEEKWRRIEVRS
jgi:hypothetical protein